MNTLKITCIPLLLLLTLCLTACTPENDPMTASISGGIFFDCDKDGDCAEDEAGIPDMCVRLYHGACGENMIQNHNTNKDGEYRFTGLEAGEYCVMTDFELRTCGYAGNHPTTSISRHVVLEVGQHAELEWFGFGNLSETTQQ